MSLAKDIFLTRHGDLRAAWCLFLFVVLATGLGTGALLAAAPLPGGTVTSTDLPLLAALLLTTVVMVRVVHRKPVRAIGLWLSPAAGSDLGLGVALGMLMMTGIAAVQFGAGALRITWTGGSGGEAVLHALSGAAAFLVSGAWQELLFRGYLFQVLIMGITFLPASLVMSILFAWGHSWNPGAGSLALINLVLGGLWFSVAYMKTRRLWLPWGLHVGWNFAQGTLVGFPTSGLTDTRWSLCVAEASGPSWLTGGAFGPEGSVLATLALLFSTWFILKTPLFAPPEGIITLDSLEDLLPNAGTAE